MEFKIIEAVLPSFAIAFLGYIYSVRDSTLDMKSIANLIYYVFSPCLVFSSMVKRSFHTQEFFMIGSSVVVLIFTMMLVTWMYMKITRVNESGFYLPIIFMNTGNIALPMAYFLYGNEGLSKAIVFHLVNVMFLYSMGVFLVSKKTDLKEFFKIPFLYAAFFGVAIASIDITVPEAVNKYVSMIGDAIDIIGKGAVPLLILSLGYSLKRTRLADLKHGIAGAGMRIILGPTIAFGLIAFFRHIGWSPVEPGYDLIQFAEMRTTESVIVLMGCMPAPITSFLLNEKFENCPEKAASMVLIGTLAGVVTIPLVLAISERLIFGQ
jgi:predicted permease